MMIYIKRAFRDIFANSFLNAVTIATVALSALIVGAFMLFFINGSDILDAWTRNIRMMAYLEPDLPAARIAGIETAIQETDGAARVRFISKETALELMKGQMPRHAGLLEDLKENPLPDAFEILTGESCTTTQQFERLAGGVEALPGVAQVEYGRKWLGRCVNLIQLFKTAGYALGSLFFIAAVFFMQNVIRLVLYARSEEMEIMQLVGASGVFIKTPLYIQAALQAVIGAGVGLSALYGAFAYMTAHMGRNVFAERVALSFLPVHLWTALIAGSAAAGVLGCFISLRQFLK